MKTLTLLRHAKSTWDDAVARDFDRPLNARGRKAARTVGAEMRRLGLRFDAVVASPAARVVDTLGEVAAGYGAALEERYDERLYLATAATLIEIVHEADAAAGSLLLVGHNPGLEALAMMLTGEDKAEDADPLRAALAIKYPTATLAEIALEVTTWDAVGAGTGRLRRFVRPRDLDPELGPDEDSY